VRLNIPAPDAPATNRTFEKDPTIENSVASCWLVEGPRFTSLRSPLSSS
jgi:hypothetical protein